MDLTEDPRVKEILDDYPDPVRLKLRYLRQLILDTASETEGIHQLEETLKWGEPSYLTASGSTIRMDWKKATPDQYAMYFTCTTGLIDTFRMIYGDRFRFEGNRAIVFDLSDKVPVPELKHCISLALTYHRIKHLSLLGVDAVRSDVR